MAQTNVIDLIGPIAEVCRGCPTPNIIKAYIDAARTFCAKSLWLRDTVTGATVADVPLYNLGTDAYSEIIGVVAVSLAKTAGETEPLTEQDSNLWDPDDDAGVPKFYQYVPSGQLALHITPDAIYALTVSVVIQPLLAATSIDSRLVPTMGKVIEAKATAQILRIGGMPWSDSGRAAELERGFDVAVGSASAQAGRGYNPASSYSAASGNPPGVSWSQTLPI